MNDADVVIRARSAIGQKCVYVLGKGGMDPLSPSPWTIDHECDCSGFACWARGISRFMAGVWLGTDQIDLDAELPGGLFTAIPREQATPGCMLVFPHRVKGRHGHVGIVATVDSTGPLTVVHCSLGNWQEHGDAIQETGCGVFWLNRAIVARFTGDA